MARYEDEFMGIRGAPGHGYGRDPNHRGGYGGMRMRGGPGQAAYGWHRWTHPRDFAGSGGYAGAYGGELESGYERFPRPPARYDREMRGGERHRPEHLRDYNAERARFAPRYGREYHGWGGSAGYDGGYRGDYGRHGLSRGGYSESWAWGPMRGAR